MKAIQLSTGVKITHDKQGNIKSLYSPYMDDLVFEQPTLDVEYSRSLKNLFKAIFKK